MNGVSLPGDKDVTSILRDYEDIDVFYILVILASSWLLLKVVKWFFPWIAAKVPARFRFHILPLVPILRLVILIAVVILVVPKIIQPKFENLVAILGALALAIGFAFKDYVSSLAAGMVAVYEHPYRPGDWVKIDDAYGEVQSVEARSLRLLTLDDTFVTIPHKKIWDSNVYNRNNARRELMCIAHFYLHPHHDAATVRQKLLEVALTSPYLQFKRSTSVIVEEKPWYTHYQLRAYPVEGRDQNLFITDLTIRGKSALAEMDVGPPMYWRMPPSEEEAEEPSGRGNAPD
jgi:small-conductance mechanosensitive channel